MRILTTTAAALAAALLSHGAANVGAQEHHSGHVAPAASARGAKYACPMHPEVVSDAQGKCPKCGMRLVESTASAGHDMAGMGGHAMAPAHQGEPTVSFDVRPASGLNAGTRYDFVASLKDDAGNPVTFDDLAEAHTKKFHLLVVDPSLTDYHHEHPVATSTPGEYAFSFAPKMSGTYKLYADLVPTATGEQEYATATVAVTGAASPVVEATNMGVVIDGLAVSIAFESPELIAGEANLMTLSVAGADGKPFRQLEPIMGAYAHLVAFSADRESIAHVHPMGEEPQSETERGGPTLQFHLEFPEAGYQKLFAQFQVNGKDVFAPFGLEVKPGSGVAKSGGHAHGLGAASAGSNHGGHGNSDEPVAIPATVVGIMKAVDERVARLDSVVASGQLDHVHAIAFEVRDLLLAIPSKAKGLSAEKAKSLESSLGRIKQQAGLLDRFGDAGDGAQTKAVLAKFKAEIETIRQIVASKGMASASTEGAIKIANNAECPVSGSAVGSMQAGAAVEYGGYSVGLCCMGCEKKFLKDGDANLRKALASASGTVSGR